MAKSILITNYEIAQYSGSEINAATIAKRMKELGYKVYIAGLNFAAPLYENVKENFDVCIDLKSNEFDFSEIEFDIVWAHHFFLLDWLIFEKNIRAKKVIYSSLSGKEYFEAPPIYANELNFILANSQETKEQMNNDGINNIKLLENYSFIEYFNRNINVKKLKKLAIISNHIPEELHEAEKILVQRGYIVDIYGIEGKQELITDKILENYDAIITIGKTVQYAMSLRIPVYIYDRFGGPGYLKMSNMEQNRAHNFSGRSYEKKTKEQLCEEVINDFKNVLIELDDIKKYALENFCFEKKIDNVIKDLENQDDVNLQEIRTRYEKYARNMLASKNLIIYMQKIMNDIKEKEKDQIAFDYIAVQKKKEQTIEKQEKDINDLVKSNKKLKQELNKIYDSKFWKIFYFFIKK